MSLSNGYGVVIGNVESHFIESPDNEGNWPHYVINVQTPVGLYKCVINLKSRSDIKIEYKDLRYINKSMFQSILSKQKGFYLLNSNSESGAIDFIRHEGLQNQYPDIKWDKLLSLKKSLKFKSKFKLRYIRKNDFKKENLIKKWLFSNAIMKCNTFRWESESGTNIIDLLEYYLHNVDKIYIWGEPFTTGLGIHNIHMNQGDPIGSRFAEENGVWQDGAIMITYINNPRVSVLCTKFMTQNLITDNNGTSN